MIHPRNYRRAIITFAFTFMLGLALLLSNAAWLQSASHAAGPFTVTNNLDSGIGTLRQAIMDAENNAGTDTIQFAIGTGAQTITLASPLPTITDPLIIDGTTQPGYAGTPLIALDGVNLGGGSSGLLISAGASTVKGLNIQHFNTDGIRLFTKGGNTITGNYIGIDLTGTAAAGNAVYGIEISDSPNNIIGGTTGAARNLISGNGISAILVTGNSSTGNLIQGNFVGTDATGTAKVGNGQPGNTDALVVNGSNNTIGGTAAGAGNLVSGNNNNGISVFGTANIVQGNLVGTDPTGNAALGNFRDGIIVGGKDGIIGGTTAGARNVVSGNSGIGVDVCCGGNATGNQVQGNFIGLKADGSGALGNSEGVRIASNNANNTIGGTAAGAGNVVSGNFNTGIEITQNQVTGNQVVGNLIGLNPAGTAAMSNGSYGIRSNKHWGTLLAARLQQRGMLLLVTLLPM